MSEGRGSLARLNPLLSCRLIRCAALRRLHPRRESLHTRPVRRNRRAVPGEIACISGRIQWPWFLPTFALFHFCASVDSVANSEPTWALRTTADFTRRNAASGAGISLPALGDQGYCLTCAGRLENGGEVDQSDSLVYFPEDREAGFVLLCTGKLRSALRLRTHQAGKMREYRKEKGLLAPFLEPRLGTRGQNAKSFWRFP